MLGKGYWDGMRHGPKGLRLVFADCWQSSKNWDREGSGLLLMGTAGLAQLARFGYKKLLLLMTSCNAASPFCNLITIDLAVLMTSC